MTNLLEVENIINITKTTAYNTVPKPGTIFIIAKNAQFALPEAVSFTGFCQDDGTMKIVIQNTLELSDVQIIESKII